MVQRVLVTGANGFVGGHVCKRLAHGGVDVVGTVQCSESVSKLPHEFQPIVTGDICADFDWSSALDGVDAVVHLAARTHVVRDRTRDPLSAYRRVNVAGTKNLLSACKAANVSRFLFLSSIKAVGEGASVRYSESTICKPADAYGISKRETELCIAELTRETSTKPIIIRSPLVYGPGVRGNFCSLMKLIDRGLPLPVASVRNSRSVIFVDNLADAIASTLTHPAAIGETFHVADDRPISTPELIGQIAVMLQRRQRMFACPVSALTFAARLLKQSGRAKRLTGSLTVSTEKIHRLLAWTPSISFETGLRRTVEWFQTNGGQSHPAAFVSDRDVEYRDVDRAA